MTGTTTEAPGSAANAPGMAANSSTELATMHDTASTIPVSPSPEPIEHDYAVGDCVRFECPGNAWHGEIGTIVPPLNYVIKGTHFVRMDHEQLGMDGIAFTSDTFLRRAEGAA